MSRTLWAKVIGRDAFRVSLPDGSYVSDLKKAIKTELAVEFQFTDAPNIIIKNRVGDVVPGDLEIEFYSPLEIPPDDGKSLGIIPNFPYIVQPPSTGDYG